MEVSLHLLLTSAGVWCRPTRKNYTTSGGVSVYGVDGGVTGEMFQHLLFSIPSTLLNGTKNLFKKGGGRNCACLGGSIKCHLNAHLFPNTVHLSQSQFYDFFLLFSVIRVRK